MVTAIRTKVNTGFHAMVVRRLSPADKARLGRMLLVDPVSRRSGFDRLKDPAKAATIGKLKQRLAHLAGLDALGRTEEWLEGVPPGKVGHFAGEAKVTDAADFRKVGEDKRLTLLISLVHMLRVSARDEIVDMFCKRMAIIHKRGKDRLEELREEHRAESERLLDVLGDVLSAAGVVAACAVSASWSGDSGRRTGSSRWPIRIRVVGSAKMLPVLLQWRINDRSAPSACRRG
ncbi:MAG: hypothetical protein ACRDRP_21380 [Pseudonocardiaceae bacterium]